MLTKDAEAYFGTRANIVRALPKWTKSAIYQWKDVVPLRAALELEKRSEGTLKVDLDRYYEISGKKKQRKRQTRKHSSYSRVA
jgi:hypothetical protein